MSVSYAKFFHLLIDKGITTQHIIERAGVSGNVITRLRRNEFVSLESIAKICAVLGCKVDDILDFTEKKEN